MNQDAAAGLPELRQAHNLNANCAVTLCWLGFYEAVNGSPEAGVRLAEAAQAATPLILGTIAHVGLGRIERAAAQFRRVERIAPKLVEARLSGRWLSSDPNYHARAHTFFRIAAGLAPPQAADALR